MTQPAVTTLIWKGAPLRDHLLIQVRTLALGMARPPRMAIVQVGHNPASSTYVRNKLLACAQAGIMAEHVHLREDEGETALMSVIRGLAADPEVDAVIVQTPLPYGWDMRAALDAVPAAKDVDGLSRASIELRRAGSDLGLLPATPLGIFRILGNLGVGLAGTKVAVIGKGMVVGAPLQEMLVTAGAEVVGIDKDTPHPASLCVAADIVIAAAGAPALVRRDWVKPGAVVIDVGISRTETEGKAVLQGDVHRLEVEGVARILTPVPGGVGPMTVASLMTNIVDAARLKLGQQKYAWNLDAPAL